MVGRASLAKALKSSTSLASINCFQGMGIGANFGIGFGSQGFETDLRYANHILIWGSSMRDGGPCGVCWSAWQEPMRQARKRGMTAVLVDPRLEAGANQIDEWVPIKAATDVAMMLAMMHVLIEEGYLDVPFLVNHTNAPFLVKEDGHWLKVDEKNVVWDTKKNAAVAFDAEGVAPALEGGYTVDGAPVKTAFQLLKEHVAENTPEWASEITTVPAEQIRRLAITLGKEARIGSTITIDGMKLPYRPVGMMSYHGLGQQEAGFAAGWAGTMIFMLLGAIQAVGGFRVGFETRVNPGFAAFEDIKIIDKPTDTALTSYKQWPIGGGSTATLAYMATADPDKYGVDKELLPEFVLSIYGNPFLSNAWHDTKKALEKIPFLVGIDGHLVEHLDHYADVVLPCATIEKLDGLIDVTTPFGTGDGLRLPIVPPLYDSKWDMNIYLDIAEACGVLTGKGGMVEAVNGEFGLKDDLALDIEKKPEATDIFERWTKAKGHPEGLKFWEEKGVAYKDFPPKVYYAPAWDTPYGGVRYRLYGEPLLTCREKMQEMGVDELFWQDYNPLPTWRTPTIDQSPEEYDLVFADVKNLPLFHSQATYNPLLHEMAPEQVLMINTRTAADRGLKDGDMAAIEAHNAITGETRKEVAKVRAMEGMQPDTVLFYHGYGHWVHPVSKGSGPAGSFLFFNSEGYMANPTATSSCRSKVKVSKA
jgi:anaerobic selenocysteine-containing dehydrogenase